ncbi:hypothetical protein MEZE111188_05850 [Mesobacillus zeae]
MGYILTCFIIFVPAVGAMAVLEYKGIIGQEVDVNERN